MRHDLPVMILCGGMGTRLRDVSEVLPKPMVPVGSYPIVWHVMKSYAAWGCRRFILCLGYKREAFIDWFLHYDAYRSDVTITLGPGGKVVHESSHDEDGWEVTLADTGLDTMTGGRVRRALRHLCAGEDRFHLTYGDGLADVRLDALCEDHARAGALATISAVHPSGRFGELDLDGDRVMQFNEKPQTTEGYINGGFMVLERAFVERYLQGGDQLVLEEEPLRRAAQDRQLAVHRHEGFWQCMDTAREHRRLNELWQSGSAPWARPVAR